MRSKVFETGGYIYIDSPNAKGWHQCEPEEFNVCRMCFTC